MSKITVIIPTLNSEKELADCLNALQEQTFKDFEVLIVDSHSKDKTVEIAKKYNCRVVYDDGKTRGHACNTGIRNTESEFIAFTDADCIPKKDWLEKLIEHFKDEKIASIGGPNTAPYSDSFFAKVVDVVYGSKIMSGETRYGVILDELTPIEHNPGCNSAYKTKVAKEIMFDEDLPTAEDVVFDYKILKSNYKIYFTPYAIVFHHRRPTLIGYYKQVHNYGKGRGMANKKYPELIRKTHKMPTIALFSFIGLILLGVVLYGLRKTDIFAFQILPIPIYKIIFYFILFLLILYFLIGLYGSAASYSLHKNWKTTIVSPFLISVGHIAWAIGYLRGIMK